MIKLLGLIAVAAFIYGVVFFDDENKFQVNETKKEVVLSKLLEAKVAVMDEYQKMKEK